VRHGVIGYTQPSNVRLKSDGTRSGRSVCPRRQRLSLSLHTSGSTESDSLRPESWRQQRLEFHSLGARPTLSGLFGGAADARSALLRRRNFCRILTLVRGGGKASRRPLGLTFQPSSTRRRESRADLSPSRVAYVARYHGVRADITSTTRQPGFSNEVGTRFRPWRLPNPNPNPNPNPPQAALCTLGNAFASGLQF